MADKFKELPIGIQQAALKQAERAATGQAITNYYRGEFSSELVYAYAQLKREYPEIAKATQRGSEYRYSLKTGAAAGGFTSLKEYQQISAVFQKKFETDTIAMQKAAEKLEAQKILLAQQEVLKQQGLKPIYSDGELKGFESSKVQQSFKVEDIARVQPSAVEPLKKAGIITVEEAPTPKEAEPEKPSIIKKIISTTAPFKAVGISGIPIGTQPITLKESITSPLQQVITAERMAVFGRIIEPTGFKALGIAGINIESQALEKAYLINKEVLKFQSGITTGIIEDVLKHPERQAILFGAGLGIGAGLKVIGVGAKAIGLGAPAKVITRIGATTLAGLYGFGIAKEISQAQDIRQIGGIVGVSAKDLLLFGGGAKIGARFVTPIITKPPTPRMKFISEVTQIGKISKVDIASTISIGGKKTGFLSRQIVREINNAINIGLGKGVSVSKVKGGRIFTKFDIAGVSKQLGKARYVKPIDTIKISTEAGMGVKGKVLTQETLRMLERQGIGLFKRFGKVKKIPKTIPSKVTDITGIIKQSEVANILRFVGKTGKPITRITKEGITLILKEPNIKGLIKVLPSKTTAKGVKFMTKADITKTPLSKTFATQLTKQITKPVSKQVQKAITQQVAGHIQQAEKLFMTSIMKPSISKGISKVFLPISTIFKEPIVTKIKRQPTKISPVAITRFLDQTGVSRLDTQTRQLFGDLGVMETRFKTDLGIKQPTIVTKQKLQPINLLSEKTLLKIIQPTKTIIKQQLQLKPQLKTLIGEKELLRELLGLQIKPALKTKLRVKPIQIFKTFPFGFPSIRELTPKELIPPISFPFLKAKKKKKRKRRERLQKVDDLFYVPSATARFLDIRKIMSKAEITGLAREGGIRMRAIPIIKNELGLLGIKKRRKKKVKRRKRK